MTVPSDFRDAMPFGDCVPDDARREFVAAALAARLEALQSGECFAAEEVHVCLRARVCGRDAPRLVPLRWRGDGRTA